jgi:hypothetical protein
MVASRVSPSGSTCWIKSLRSSSWSNGLSSVTTTAVTVAMTTALTTATTAPTAGLRLRRPTYWSTLVPLIMCLWLLYGCQFVRHVVGLLSLSIMNCLRFRELVSLAGRSG